MPPFPSQRTLERKVKSAKQKAQQLAMAGKLAAAEKRATEAAEAKARSAARAQIKVIVRAAARLAERGHQRVRLRKVSALIKHELTEAGFEVSPPGQRVQMAIAFDVIRSKYPNLDSSFIALGDAEKEEVLSKVSAIGRDWAGGSYVEVDLQEFAEALARSIQRLAKSPTTVTGRVLHGLPALAEQLNEAMGDLRTELSKDSIDCGDPQGVVVWASWGLAPGSDDEPKLPAAVLKWISFDGKKVLRLLKQQLTAEAETGAEEAHLKFELSADRRWRLAHKGALLTVPSDYRTVAEVLSLWGFTSRTEKVSKDRVDLAVSLVAH
jgi:hypothetical protein